MQLSKTLFPFYNLTLNGPCFSAVFSLKKMLIKKGRVYDFVNNGEAESPAFSGLFLGICNFLIAVLESENSS